MLPLHLDTPAPLARLVRAALFGLTLASASGLALLSSPAVAQANTSYQIPAGPLGAALTRFGVQAGVTLSFDTEQTRQLTTPGLSGSYSVEEGLQRLLANSGLQAQRQANGGYVLVAASTDGSLELGPTNVTGAGLGETTEGSKSYTTGSTSTATRMNLSLRETPQSVSVVTRQQMDDQNMQSLEDVARAATGINTAKDFGTERSRYFSRGFQVNDLQYDGVPTSISESYSMDVTSVNNMAIYDRVEFVRGANGLRQGAGNPSAAINLVRKRPTDTYQLKAEIGAGSWDNYHSQIDVGGPLNEQGTLRGRAVLLYNGGNSFVDRADKENQLFYAIGEADLSESTTLSLGTVLQKDYHGGYDWGGLPTQLDGSFYPLSRSSSFAPSWAHLNKINRTVFADIRHGFNDDWKLTVNTNLSWSNADFLGLYGNNIGNDQFRLFTNDTKYDDEQISIDAALNGAFYLLGQRHELVFGANARKDRFINESRYNNNPSVVDILDFSPSQVVSPSYGYERIQYRNVRKDKGFYAATRLNPSDELHVILGSRFSWVDYESADYEDRFKENGKVIPYAGVVYDLTDSTSVYASYTEIYQVQNNYDITNKLLDPITGSNYEVGLKNEFYDGLLNTSVAVFQVDQSHMPQAVTGAARICGPGRTSTCYEEGGKVRNRGFEVEASGEILKGWNAVVGYTYSHPEYVGGARKGTDYASETAPRRLFKLASSYRLPGDLSDWRVGGDLYHQSKVYKGSVEQGAYNLVGLNASYQINRNLSAQLNLDNVFDKKYYAAIYNSNLGNYYGEPRNFAVTLRYEN
ncbi:TonB-dependent siderophore receptor [Pseudomonas sp. 148P]|uniref:TonB-dependent siderophore receptor n=1 Tax=Pseudomonas ulcerans TaxID=3115852 RepID=A0ABU7HS33_9PSED|nr:MULTISPECIES: TonB-dependent siderophore receptor [unclassified Pseudomonas]MEE1923375.1 TonB-dependent siderophore receptor [Pseudomonas sp. 147P]MEE1934347.1 TonB-dependent siderophore receptor [Pseudomonas sp. 148P]